MSQKRTRFEQIILTLVMCDPIKNPGDKAQWIHVINMIVSREEVQLPRLGFIIWFKHLGLYLPTTDQMQTLSSVDMQLWAMFYNSF
jgi:hypothetical protein